MSQVEEHQTESLVSNEQEDSVADVERLRRTIALTYSKNLKFLRDRIEDIETSLSYKLGFLLTAPGRLLMSVFGGKPFTLIPQTHKKLFSAQTELDNLMDMLGEKSLVSRKEFDVAETDFNKEAILVIFPEIPMYDKSSGGRRANRLLKILCEHFNVYVFSEGILVDKYVQHLNDVGCVVLPYLRDHKTLMRMANVRAIVYSFYYTFHNYKDIAQFFPEAKIVVDSVDVHWVREQRGLGIYEGLNKRQVQINKGQEIEAYREADAVWAVTAEDRLAILEELPDKEVRIVSNVHDIHVDEYIHTEDKKLLFFGGFRHYPNISAVHHIVDEIFPEILGRHPDCKLIIAGSNAPESIINLGKQKNIDFRGFVEEEQLEELYREATMSLCPLLIGAGIKGKVCEAIAHAVPVATNSTGNEGINLVNEQEALVSDDPKELARLVSYALDGQYDLSLMSRKAQEKLTSLTSTQAVTQNMLDSLVPHVVISIVTWNRLDFLQKCIESIEGNTNYPNYSIVVHSNGCEDGTQDYLSAAAKINPRIKPVLSQDNDVFVKPNNAIMNAYPDSDVVLLNNDTQVTPNWLRHLQIAAYSKESIGIAGSKVLYPDGKLQEFGSELYGNGTGRNIGKWDDPSKEDYKHMKRVGYVSGCSMYIKRSTIEAIGVFDEQFHPCYCEDSDYCYSAWKEGLETVVVPNSIIFHFEGGTSGTDETSGFKKYQVENFKKFLAKHGKEVDALNKKISELNG